jgi:endoplasmic reticulum protein 29
MCRLALIAAALIQTANAYTDRGIIKLDNTTFDRIIDGGKTVFARFDKEYSYGDEHDAWKELASKVGDSSADMLTADVGVSEYGDKDNSDIAEKYSISSDDFPSYRLFMKGTPSSGEPIKYTGDKKYDAFLRFLQEKAGGWSGLPGQIKSLDERAKEFVGGDKAAVIKKAEVAAGALEAKDTDSGKYYVKVMGKISEKADFVAKETERLQKMIDDGSVKAAKKEQFGRRLNILSSFA